MISYDASYSFNLTKKLSRKNGVKRVWEQEIVIRHNTILLQWEHLNEDRQDRETDRNLLYVWRVECDSTNAGTHSKSSPKPKTIQKQMEECLIES